MSDVHSFGQTTKLPGSNRTPLPGATVGDRVPDDEQFTVTIRLRRKTPLPAYEPGNRLSRAEYNEKHGSDPNDIELVKEFAAFYKLTVNQVLLAQRMVMLEGTAEQFSKAFGVELRRHTMPDGSSYRGRDGVILIPVELSDRVTGVFGLDNRPVFRRYFRSGDLTAMSKGSFQTQSGIQSYYANQVAEIYNFPKGLDGSGQTIGIVEMGGGFQQADLTTYFQSAGVNNPPEVTVADIPGGGSNTPAPKDPEQPDVEVLLDMEVVASVAPASSIVMYFAQDNSNPQLLLAVSTAVHDEQSDLAVISMSWMPEYDDITPIGRSGHKVEKQFQDSMNEDLEAAAHLGITVTVSSGDSASSSIPLPQPEQQDVWDGRAHVGFPASSPWVLACGGTHIVSPSPLQEESWHPEARVGTGGGISRYFPRPSYQAGAVTISAVNPPGASPMRGVPDVAGDAAQESGYKVRVDGKWYPTPAQRLPPIGGTSAVAPLWAGLVALMNQGLNKRLGFINTALYGLASSSGALNDITKGNNDDYAAGQGWDACTGLGTPNGTQLMAALANSPAAGAPAPATLASNLFSDRFISRAARKSAMPFTQTTSDPYAAVRIEHNFLDDLAAHQLMMPEAERVKPWTDIPWPQGLAPKVLPDALGQTLPKCDVVLITYTTDEGNAMAAVLTSGFLAVPPKGSSAPGWTSYTHNYAQYVPDLVPRSSPALNSKNLGCYKLVQIGDKRVLCFKSSLHLARDSQSVPVMRLVDQICQETGASLVITTGTGGGIGDQVELGDAVITTSATFHMVKHFADEPFNNSTVTSSFILKTTSFLDTVNETLIGTNAGRLSSRVAGNRPPKVAVGANPFGEPNTNLTTDTFLFDDADNTSGLQDKGVMCEMDDAPVGLAILRMGPGAPTWLAIRNASDPQMPAGSTEGDANNVYLNYGFYTSFTSVLACWACVLGS